MAIELNTLSNCIERSANKSCVYVLLTQLAEVLGSKPSCSGFESLVAHHFICWGSFNGRTADCGSANMSSILIPQPNLKNSFEILKKLLYNIYTRLREKKIIRF